MSEEEKMSIFSAPEFLDFVEQSTKIIQRALNDNYDYIRDYTIGTESGTWVTRYVRSWGQPDEFIGKPRKEGLNVCARSTMSGMGKTALLPTSTGHRRLVFAFGGEHALC